MDIIEAKELLNKGWLITHRLFWEGEFIRKVGNCLKDEDDNILIESDFWCNRSSGQWLVGWEKYENND
jgi:hypothetical protein